MISLIYYVAHLFLSMALVSGFTFRAAPNSPWICRSSLGLNGYEDDTTEVRTPTKILYVGNLPFSVLDADLADIIEDKGIGGVASTRVATTRDGRPRGFGFIDFNSEQDAQNALEALTGLQLGGRELKLDFDFGTDNPTKGRRASPTSKQYSAFVGNLDFGMDEESLSDIIRQVSREDLVFKVRFAYIDGRFRGFGHVECGNDEDVEEIISALSGIDVLGRTLRVERAQERTQERPQERSGDRPFGRSRDGGDSNSFSRSSRPPMQSSSSQPQKQSIYIGNLPYDVTVKDIADMIDGVVGPNLVKAVRISVDRDTGATKGFGHADFDTLDHATSAQEKLDGIELMGRRLRVDIASPSRGGAGGGGRGGDRGSFGGDRGSFAGARGSFGGDRGGGRGGYSQSRGRDGPSFGGRSRGSDSRGGAGGGGGYRGDRGSGGGGGYRGDRGGSRGGGGGEQAGRTFENDFEKW